MRDGDSDGDDKPIEHISDTFHLISRLSEARSLDWSSNFNLGFRFRFFLGTSAPERHVERKVKRLDYCREDVDSDIDGDRDGNRP